MKILRLQVWSRDRVDKVAELVWEDGKTSILSCSFEDDAKKWIEHGLHEMVGPLDNPEPRHTASSDYVFLERLGSYLKKQTGFVIMLSEMEAFAE